MGTGNCFQSENTIPQSLNHKVSPEIPDKINCGCHWGLAYKSIEADFFIKAKHFPPIEPGLIERQFTFS